MNTENVKQFDLPVCGGPYQGGWICAEGPTVLLGSLYSGCSGLNFYHRYDLIESYCWSHMGIMVISSMPLRTQE